MLMDCKDSSVYNNSKQQRSYLWKQGSAQFAKKKKHTIVFIRARMEKMDMEHNVKFVDLQKVENITKTILKSVLRSMKDGVSVILRRFSKTKELIMNVIKKKFWRNCENQEKKMDMQTQKLIEREIERKLNVIITFDWLLNSVILSNLIHVIFVKINVLHTRIILTTQNLLKWFGCVENVMVKSIGEFYQRERLSLEGSKKEYTIVQTTEETCREESEVVLPPRNWSVSSLWLKVIEWLRHTAGCSFYQGQCITNDLWVQNLRSTGI
jgi:hypothetical protein